MKTISMIRISLAAAALLFFANCGGKKEASAESESTDHATSTDAPVTSSGPLFTVDDTFKEQLTRTFNAYLKVKDAFVASDAALVKVEAGNTKKIIKAIDAKMLTGPALNDWTNYSNNLDMALAEILATDDIEAQRTAFSSLSDNLYKSIKAYGLGSGTAYYDFCPMAFNNQGGFWLSDNKEIRNPYFGDKMLTCGRVTEELN